MDLAPIYGIDVGTFRDANGDGVGDLRGVTESLDHVERLGAGWIWLLPFFTSPMRDNGYDVADHYRIHEPFGTFGDFVDLVGEARRRNIKVMIDLVVNHTSDQHSWFRAARADPDGPFRDYYVWTDSPPPLDGDPRRIRLAFSILFAHPGAPMIVYGDEIGMGDDQSIPERGAVRTAMQWTSGPNAGFSHAPGDRIDVPIVRDPAYAPERVNVADQEHDPDSLLSFVRHLSRVRRETAALRGGGVQLDTTAGGRVLTTCSATPAGMLVTLANLSPSRQSVPPMWPPSARPEVLAGAADRTRHGALELDGYGFAWLRVPRA